MIRKKARRRMREEVPLDAEDTDNQLETKM